MYFTYPGISLTWIFLSVLHHSLLKFKLHLKQSIKLLFPPCHPLEMLSWDHIGIGKFQLVASSRLWVFALSQGSLLVVGSLAQAAATFWDPILLRPQASPTPNPPATYFKAWPKEAEIVYHHKRFYKDAAQPKARPTFYIIKQNGYQRCLEHPHLVSGPPKTMNSCLEVHLHDQERVCLRLLKGTKASCPQGKFQRLL